MRERDEAGAGETSRAPRVRGSCLCGAEFHTYVDSRAPWDDLTDDLPRFAAAWHPDGPRGERVPPRSS